MKMPFGKFKGHEVRDLPGDYLCWLFVNLVAKPGPLRECVADEFFNRFALYNNTFHKLEELQLKSEQEIADLERQIAESEYDGQNLQKGNMQAEMGTNR